MSDVSSKIQSKTTAVEGAVNRSEMLFSELGAEPERWRSHLFPGLSGDVCRVNLDKEAQTWTEQSHLEPLNGKSPFLNPSTCAEFLLAFHQSKNVSWSYGGWLEERRFLWRGSYLEATGNFIHLGVDFNVPQGTRVGARKGQIFLLDDDGDTEGGWGSRIFLQPDGGDVILIYAHLQNVCCQVGDRVDDGETFAEVGGPPGNGNWYPHLHVQAIQKPVFEEILRERFHELDGYGHPNNLTKLALDYPNPLPLLATLGFP